jgi:radical SAM protein with 4Fe4S-binding SPASM domain
MSRRIDFHQDGHKMLHHLDRVVAWQRGERVAPIHIELGTGPRCNFNCVFCFTAFQKRNTYVLDRETFLKIMRDSAEAGVRSIGILGDGEPTLNPALIEAVQLGHALGLDIGLATNGLLLDEAASRALLPHLVWIRFTTCAGTPETFARVHRIPERNFATVLENIARAVAVRRELGLSTTIGMQMVLVPENIEEARDAARLARSLGVDYFTAKQASLSPKNAYSFDYDLYDRHRDLLAAVEQESTADFAATVAWKKIFSKGVKSYTTCWGYQFLFQVTGKGEVYPCSELAGDGRFLIGDFRTESLGRMLSGEQYGRVIRNMEELLDMDKDCATCCRHDAVNAFLWTLRNPPDHINFI